MSVSDVRVRSEGQLRALMTKASAVVLPALIHWLGGSELNGVTQIAGLRTLMPFCSVCSIQMGAMFLSLAVYCHFILDFWIVLLCMRWAHPPGLCALGPQFKTSAASMAPFECEESMLCVFSEIILICCPSEFFITALSQSILVIAGASGSSTLSTWRKFIIHAGQVETAGSVSVNNLKCVLHRPNSSKSNTFIADLIRARDVG